MKTLRLSTALTLCSLMLSMQGYGQTAQKPAPAVTAATSVTGLVYIVSATEIHLKGIDGHGKSIVYVFKVTAATTLPTLKVGDAVSVLYEANGASRVAKKIVLLGQEHRSSPIDQGGVGGVASARPQASHSQVMRNVQQLPIKTADAAVEPTSIASADGETVAAADAGQGQQQGSQVKSGLPAAPPASELSPPTLVASAAAPSSDWHDDNNLQAKSQQADSTTMEIAGATAPPSNLPLTQDLLEKLYPLTKTTADRSDILRAGAVLTLKADGLTLESTAGVNSTVNFYRSGRIEPFKSYASSSSWSKLGLKRGGMTSTPVDEAQRKFVAGEKVWVTGVHLKLNDVVFDVYSDPYNDVRYYGKLDIPIVPGSTTGTLSAIGKVILGESQSNETYAAAAPAQMAAMAPPPAPDSIARPLIEIGQTKDQVVAAFGEPVKSVKLSGTKEIYFYKDMKITFMNGKVANVE